MHERFAARSTGPSIPGPRGWFLATVALAASTLSYPPFPAHAQQQCGGVERWPVKVGSDSGAVNVALQNPVTLSLHQVVALPRPQLPSDDSTRVAEEMTVYVVQGRLVMFKLESGRTGDQDYHLVVSDDTLDYSRGGSGTVPSPHSLVAEIVRPACIPGRDGAASTQSQFQQELAAVRSAFEQQFPDITGGWNDAEGIPVTIKGVGFFDRPHGQVGRALNGIELHPVLDISFGAGPLGPGGPAAPAVSTLLQNPGLESGSQGWTASTGVISDDEREPARTGNWKAWLGGYGTTHTDSLCQQISVPATAAQATLSFYLHVSTEEQTSTQQYDTLQVQVRDTSDSVLRTLTTYSNLQARPGYRLRTFDLSAQRGQTVRICFRAREDNGSMTSFVLDDFGVTVE